MPFPRLRNLLAAALPVLALLALCGWPDDALARAGGGGGYSGGGGGGGGFSGGGGGGGGDGLGLLIYFLIRLCVRHPFIGIPLLIGAVALLYYSKRSAVNLHHRRVIRRAAPALDAQRRQKAVADLRRRDPQFDEERFYQRVGDAFLKIQRAWCDQDLRPVRAFVSDGIHERFSLQFDEQRARGYRNHMENIVVQQIALAQVAANPIYDVATVRIEASAVDYRVALEGGRRLRGSTSPESFVEYWSFLRKRGAQTQTRRHGLIEGHCPNCGANVEMNQAAQCPNCDSLLRSGEYDWVLAEITQECEWRPRRAASAPGLEAYRRGHDPGVNLQQIEDHASVVFWRKAAADLQGDVAPLRKMATDEFCDKQAEKLRPDEAGIRYFPGDCAVGSVEVVGLLPHVAMPAGDEPPMDRALVEVRWSAKRFQRAPEGRLIVDNYSALYRSLLVLGRRPGVQTDIRKGVSSAHCPNCGAPESNDASSACEFCGTVLNDGRRDWVLLDLLPWSGVEAERLVDLAREQRTARPAELAEQSAATPEGTALLAWLVQAGLADKQIVPRERKMLLEVARRHHIPVDRFETMLEAAESGQLETPRPSGPEQARDWLAAAADVSLADGRVSQTEYALLRQAAQPYGLGQRDIKLLLRKRYGELYRQSKAALRGNGN